MIRRRAGLRDTFAVHRHPVTLTPNQQGSREKSPTIMQRTSTFHNSNVSQATPITPSAHKIEKDIMKHASRLRLSYYKDYHMRTINSETNPRVSSSSKASSMQRKLQSMSLVSRFYLKSS